MLKLVQLRQETYAAWELLCISKGVYLGAPESIDLSEQEACKLSWTNKTFKAEIRQQFGDLRRRDTWEQAAIALTAHQMVQSYMEPSEIVGYMAAPGYMRCPIREAYGDRLIDVMLQFPEMLDIIKRGLEQLYQESQNPKARDIFKAFLIQFSERVPHLDTIAPRVAAVAESGT